MCHWGLVRVPFQLYVVTRFIDGKYFNTICEKNYLKIYIYSPNTVLYTPGNPKVHIFEKSSNFLRENL